MRKYFVGCIAALCVISFSRSLKAQQANLPTEVVHYADTVLHSGKVLMADDKFTTVQALAIREGKILAVGNSDRMLAMAGPKTRKIDLKGHTVTPGIIDLHQHPFTEGMLSHWAQKWTPNETEWRNPQEALEGIKRAVARAKPGEVVLISRIYIGPAANEKGGRVGEAICDFMTPEEKYRSLLACAARQNGNICDVLPRAQIDSVSPNNPVIFIEIVNLGPHAMNTKAAEAVAPYLKGVDPFVKEGDACVKGASGDARSGLEGTGGQVSPAKIVKNYLIFWSEPFEESLEAYRLATRGVSSAGITLTKEHTAMQIMGGIRELWARGELTVRMRMPYPITPMTSSGNEVEVAPDQAEMLFRSVGNMSGLGDDMLRFVGIRPNAVGGNLYMGLAWTLEPKQRPYKGPDIRGEISNYGGPGTGATGEMQGQEIFNGRTAIVQAVRFGWDVSADHSVGDRAVKEILNAYEEGLNTQIVKRPGQRLTLNHTPMASMEDIERMKRMGVYASIGPWHVYLPDMLEAGVTAYGTERVNKMLPIKSYLTIGLKPSLEGDVSVAPFWRMEKAITRKDDKYKKTWNSPEAINRQEALLMSTNYPAYHIGEQDRLGTLEPGKYADLIVLDKDYMTVPDDQIHEIRPVMTLLGGKVVFDTGVLK